MDLVHRRALEPHWRHVLTVPAMDEDTRRFIHSLMGRDPANERIWLEALTHGSMGSGMDYQRMEFLGDRVLGLVIAEWLHETSEAAEGRLSQRLNALVSGATCAAIARTIGLGPHMKLGKQARDDGGRDSDNILGDVVEALIGASFLDFGFDEARAMVRRLWADAMAGKVGKAKHPKSALQEWAAGNNRKMPEYRLVERSGPDHASRFTVEVSVNGVGSAQATANSKQEAETQAASEFMRQYG